MDISMSKNVSREGHPESAREAGRLREALLSIGVDKESVGELLASRDLERIVVPIYWKDGLVIHSSTVWLLKLPEFLRNFEREFPDGRVTWDSQYYEQNPNESTSDVAIRVYFNLQEGDQGEHFSPRPTELEEESYQGMLRQAAFKGKNPVQAHAVLRGA